MYVLARRTVVGKGIRHTGVAILELRGLETRIDIAEADVRHQGEGVGVEEVAAVLVGYHHAVDGRGVSEGSEHGVEQLTGLEVGVHALNAMLHHHTGHAQFLLGRSRYLHKREVALARVVVGHQHEAALEGAVDVDLIVGCLPLLAVGHGEVGVVGTALGEQVAQRLGAVDIGQSALHAVGEGAHLPTVSELRGVAAVGHLRGDDGLIAEVEVIFLHGGAARPLEGEAAQTRLVGVGAVVSDAGGGYQHDEGQRGERRQLLDMSFHHCSCFLTD